MGEERTDAEAATSMISTKRDHKMRKYKVSTDNLRKMLVEKVLTKKFYFLCFQARLVVIINAFIWLRVGVRGGEKDNFNL